MRDNITIIIPTHNNEKIITALLKHINKIQKKHPSIREIIVTDLDSKDKTNTETLNTMVALQNTTISLITNEKPQNDKIHLIKAIGQAKEKKIIIIQPNHLPLMSDLMKAIKLLRKAKQSQVENMSGFKTNAFKE